MTDLALAAFLVASVLSATPQPAIPPASEVTLRHEIYRGQGVTAYLLEIPPGQGSQMHRHDKDLLTVFISGGRTTAVFEGFPARTDALAAGTIRYRSAGFAHSTHNDERTAFRAVLLEFNDPQGPRSEGTGPPQVFCTTGFCVDDVTVAPGGKLGGSVSTLFVPVTDAMVRESSGRRHLQLPGSIWTGSGGWVNAGREPARIIAINLR